MDPTEDTVVAWGAELLRHSNLQEAEQVFQQRCQALSSILGDEYWALGITEHMLGEDADATKHCYTQPTSTRPTQDRILSLQSSTAFRPV